MSTDKGIKLTSKQKEVIKCLQGDYSLCTDSEYKGAFVSNPVTKHQFHINNGVFWRLVDKGLIFQNYQEGFRYTLTELGETIKL